MRPIKRAAEWVSWAWNPAPENMITDHPFVPVDWAKTCGYLPHPQALRCGQPERYHTSKQED